MSVKRRANKISAQRLRVSGGELTKKGRILLVIGAENEVIGQWGGEQTLAGPFLVLPYVSRQQDEKGRVVETTEAAFFLPEELEVAVPMTLDSYVRYAMSETNVHLAIAAGRFEREIDGWCRRTLEPVFGREWREVLFSAYVAYVAA